MNNGEFTAWILGTSAALITALIGVSTYFIQKWIAAVDGHLEENSHEIKAIKEEVTEIKLEQRLQAKAIPGAIRAELGNITFKSDTEKIEETLDQIKKQVDSTPVIQKEFAGKIIMIQDRQDSTDKKVETLFNTVKILVDRWKPK